MTIKKLRNKILDLAIHGKLVKQDANDEPACTLLARIRQEKEQLVKDGKLKKKDLVTTPVSDEDKPFEVPKGWEWCRLGEYVLTVTDGDHQAPPQSLEGIPFLVISDVNTGRINFEKARFVPEDYYNALPENRKAKKGDILFTVTGSYGIVIPVDVENEFCFQRHIGLIKVIVESSWLRTILQSKYVKSYCDNVATGTAQKTVGLALLRDLPIPLPPLAEQQRIVAAVEQWMSLVDIIESGKENLQQSIALAKNKILDLAIKGKLVPQDANDEPASTLLARIRQEKEQLVKDGKLKKKDLVTPPVSDEEKPFEVPEGWEWCKLDTCTYSVGNKHNQIQSNSIEEEGLYRVVSQGGELFDGYTNDNSKVINDLPLVMFGDHTRNVKFIDFPFVIGADGTKFHKCICAESKYLYFWMKLTADCLRDRGYARHYALLKAVPIPLPPLSEQQRIVAKIEELFAQLDIISNALK